MKKVFISLLALIALSKLTISSAFAFCPICTVAVGAGLGLSRYLGVDDSVSGIWVGALVFSSALWFSSWLKKKGLKIPYRSILTTLTFYSVTLIPLYFTKIIGHPFNTLWGIDKLILGITAGSILFMFSWVADRHLRTRNNGKVFIYYQKILITMAFLIVSSLIFYLLTQ